jgi:hypothetical protein
MPFRLHECYLNTVTIVAYRENHALFELIQHGAIYVLEQHQNETVVILLPDRPCGNFTVTYRFLSEEWCLLGCYAVWLL